MFFANQNFTRILSDSCVDFCCCSFVYNTAGQCYHDLPKGHVVVTTESTVNSGNFFYKMLHNNNHRGTNATLQRHCSSISGKLQIMSTS